MVCADGAHIATDETGAPERILGAKLIDLPAPDGKLRPEQIEEVAHLLGGAHHAQPGGRVDHPEHRARHRVPPDEVAALCDAAHRLGMTVHMDGARIANATAALGGDVAALRSFTVDAGVDVLTFGGTKNGLLGGEAVVYLRSELARRAMYLRKQVTQLPSKMRFVAAQFLALLADDRWLELAGHANGWRPSLHAARRRAARRRARRRPQVNSLFPILPPDVIEPLRDWCFFWDWDVRPPSGPLDDGVGHHRRGRRALRGRRDRCHCGDCLAELTPIISPVR